MPKPSARTKLRQWRQHLATDIDRLRGCPTLRHRFSVANECELDLSKPLLFNEKIQWRKLYDRNPLFPILMDKVRMPEWARGVLASEDHHFVPDYRQVVQSADELDFDALPPDIALKANHASGWNIIKRAGQPFDEVQARRKLDNWLSRKFGKTPKLQERGYLKIPPRIAVQDLLVKADGTLADDFQLHMFGDKFGFGQIGLNTLDEGQLFAFFDEDFAPLDVSNGYPRGTPTPEHAAIFPEALRIARLLGAHLDYMRVDFLLARDVCILGEITLFHASGYSPLKPLSFQRAMGDLWQLPEIGRRMRSATQT